MNKKLARNWLYFIWGIANTVVLTVAFVTKGKVFKKIFFAMSLGFEQFGDFFGPICWHYQGINVYEIYDCNFPALGVAFFDFFSRILNVSDNTSQTGLMNSAYGAVIFMIFVVTTFILFTFAIELLVGTDIEKKWEKYYISISLVCSFPFMGYAVKTGNVVFFVLTLMMLAIGLKDSENKYCREIALLLIAFCAGMKIFPAALGLLYLKEKRWKESLRLVIYGIIFFFVPFLIYGGWSAICLFFKNMSYHGETILSVGTIPWYTTIFANSIGRPEFASILGKICVFVWCVIVLYLFFLNQYSWSGYLLLFSLFFIGSGVQQAYNLVYITIPFLRWIADVKRDKLEKLGVNDIVVPSLFIAILYCYNWQVEYVFVWILLMVALVIEVRRCCSRVFVSTCDKNVINQ